MPFSATRLYRELTVNGSAVADALRSINRALGYDERQLYLYLDFSRGGGLSEKHPGSTLDVLAEAGRLEGWYIGADFGPATERSGLVFTSRSGRTTLQLTLPSVEPLDPAFEAFETHCALTQKPGLREPRAVSTPWDLVNRTLSKSAHTLRSGQDPEDFQQVGLLCREALISLAQAVFDRTQHRSPDGIDPSSTDFKRMFDGYVQSKLRGRSNEAARRHAKAAMSLALDLQHKRTATALDASLCLEATSSVANIVTILERR